MGDYLKQAADGAATGVTVSAANSDDGGSDALYLAAGTYSDDWANNGATSFKVSASGSVAILGWNAGTEGGGVFRAYFRMSALPPSTCGIVQARAASGNQFEVQVRADGTLRCSDNVGALYFDGAEVLAVDTTYRLEARIWKGTGTSDGTLEFQVYVGESETPLEGISSTTEDAGTEDITEWRWGIITSSVTWSSVYFDDVAAWFGETALLGPRTVDPSITESEAKSVLVDTTGSVGAMTLVQTAGTTATVAGPAAGIFTITRPTDHTDILTFDLTADADGPDVVTEIRVQPDNLAAELIFTGSDATDIADWE